MRNFIRFRLFFSSWNFEYFVFSWIQNLLIFRYLSPFQSFLILSSSLHSHPLSFCYPPLSFSFSSSFRFPSSLCNLFHLPLHYFFFIPLPISFTTSSFSPSIFTLLLFTSFPFHSPPLLFILFSRYFSPSSLCYPPFSLLFTMHTSL